MIIDKVCISMLSQAQGLMFSRRKNLLFIFSKEKYILLHNWFVFFPINLIFLDSKNKVIEIKRNFKPFSFYRSKIKVSKLIETPDPITLQIGSKVALGTD
jgi:uncharacterized membrane protein (UPF0127 family)